MACRVAWLHSSFDAGPWQIMCLTPCSLRSPFFARHSLLQPLVARYVDRDRYLNSPHASPKSAEAKRKDRLRQRPWVDERPAVLCTY